jgi:hypothetical protein
MIEQRSSKKKGISYRVKRLEGRLTATFYEIEAARLQDALWGRWGAAIPVLADQKPKVAATLIGSLVDPKAAEISPALLANLFAAHPAREAALIADSACPLLAEYLETFLALWKSGSVPGRKKTPQSEKNAHFMEEALNRLILKILYERDSRGWRVRNEKGLPFVHPDRYAPDALGLMPLDQIRPKHILALDEEVKELRVGMEVWRKVLSFLQQLFDRAMIEELVETNPVQPIKKPPQSSAHARSAMLPDALELIRADFLYLEELAKTRVRGRKVTDSPAGVAVPEASGYARWSADFVEALGYSSCRPGELRAATADDLVEGRLKIRRRSVNGESQAGTKSKRYPTKDVFLLGPLAASLARRAESAATTKSRLLFPFPGTERQMTDEEYRRWRRRYFAPIARSHDLGEETDDPYSLRHTYGSLRAAAGHPLPHIEQSMGSSLVGRVYTTVFHEYEGKPLDIDATIDVAREKALHSRGLAVELDDAAGSMSTPSR